MKFNKEVKVGLLALVSGVMLYSGFQFLKGNDFFSKNSKYYATYEQIEGLTVSNPVLINGFSIGRIEKIELLQSENNHLKVTIEIKKEIQLTDSTEAIITNTDLLGGKSIVLKLGKNNKILPEGSNLIATKEKGFKELVAEQAFPVIHNLEEVMAKINLILGSTNQKNIASTLENINQASDALSQLVTKNGGKLDATFTNLQQFSASITETEKQLKPLLVKFNTIGDTLSKAKIASAVENANKSLSELNQVLHKVNNGTGSAGKLINDDSLYINLNHTVRDLDKLLNDLRERPKRYVHFSLFGKKDKE